MPSGRTKSVIGTPHAADYVVTDYQEAVINPAIVMAMTVIDLLGDGAKMAREVVETERPPMTKDAYLELQRGRAKVVDFDASQV